MTIAERFKHSFLATIASLALVPATALASNVAIIQGGFYTSNLKTALQSHGHTVTELGSYTAASLASYDAVVHYGNSFVDLAELETYVQNGGTLVETPWFWSNNAPQANLRVVSNGGSSTYTMANPGVTVLDASSPLLSGVSFPVAGAPAIGRTTGNTFDGSANAVAAWADGGTAMVGWRALGQGVVVAVNMHVVTSDCAYAVIDQPWASQLLSNAVDYRACDPDGTIENVEECDDNNAVDGDGCSECRIDVCWGCTGEPSTCAPSTSGTSCPADEVFCTDDICDGAGACQHPDKTAGTPCDDEDACTQVDTCQAGSCVGTDPYVCCDGSACQPSSGNCSTCPDGFDAVDGGCQRVYEIASDADLDNLLDSCSLTVRYNDCSGAYGFHWTDVADAGVGAVTAVEIQLETGVSCAAGPRGANLNANAVGAFPITGSCSCGSSHQPQTLTVDPSAYVKGGANALLTDAPGNCEGLTQDADGNYAVVTVTYAALPATPVDCDDADACTQDSCVDGDGCVNAETPLDPGSCLVALGSKLQVKDSATAAKDKLSWQWSKGEAFDQASLGSPIDMTTYTLCVYDEAASVSSLKASIDIVPSATLWTTKDPKGFNYKDKLATSDGVTKAQIKTGEGGKTSVKLSAAGASLALPGAAGSSYFAEDPNVVVQLVNGGQCWTSQFTSADTKKNDTGTFKAIVK